MAIHIHLPARQVVKAKDAQKPYVSSTKEGWEVLGNKGHLIKSFPKTDAGREAAQKYLKENFEKLTQDALSVAEAERELKNETRLIEVYKKSGKPVPKEMLQRQEMFKNEVERWKAKTGQPGYPSADAWSMVKRLDKGFALMEGTGPDGGKFALIKNGVVKVKGTEEHCMLSYKGITTDAGEKFYVKNMSGQVIKVFGTKFEADKYVSEHQKERLHVYTTVGKQ